MTSFLLLLLGLALVMVPLAAAAFSAPGVPRGAWLMFTPIVLAIGLPAEGIGILIARWMRSPICSPRCST